MDLYRRDDPTKGWVIDGTVVLQGSERYFLERRFCSFLYERNTTVGILRWSGFPRQYGAGLKWCAAPVHIASLTPGSVLQ